MGKRETLTLAGMTMILMGGIAQGLMTHRWSHNTAVADAALRLHDVPTTVGDWTSTEQTLTDTEIETGCIAGYVKREYVNAVSGARVHLLLMVGDAGPISLHPPTVCFSGHGYQVVGHQSHWSAQETDQGRAGERHAFQQADFGNSAINDPALTRLYWGWSTDGLWSAPRNPRMKYAGESALFKLYVSERWVPRGQVNDTGAARLFLEEILPHVRQSLQSAAPPQETKNNV